MAFYILAVKNTEKVEKPVATSGKSGTFKVKNKARAD